MFQETKIPQRDKEFSELQNILDGSPPSTPASEERAKQWKTIQPRPETQRNMDRCRMILQDFIKNKDGKESQTSI
jgi:hypothetical protein